ncbi:hypothetical protein [Clostridium botulinum]
MWIKTTVIESISLNEWLDKYAPKMKPYDCIIKLKELKVKEPKTVYKNWRKNYMKSKVV